MRQSKFNKYYKMHDGITLIFNAFSCALAIADEKFYELLDSLENLSDSNVPEYLLDCYNDARDAHFIIDDECNELLEYKNERRTKQYSNSFLDLTIAPTLSCNFKCIYCYESARKGNMSTKIQESILDFIRQQTSNLKTLNVNWYGGEPLLAPDIIKNISSQIIKICKENNIQYSASIVTNGSLIDSDTIQILKDAQIKAIQITIDGPASIHNARRISKNGSESYLTILENINSLLADSSFDIVLRVNIDKTNTSALETLLLDLSERLINKQLKIYVGQVSAYTEACKSVESICLSNEEYAYQKIINYELLKKHGFIKENDFMLYPSPKFLYCSAELLNSFVIDPDGYMYKCWNEVGIIEQSVGNIANGLVISNYKNAKWTKHNPLHNDTCKDCKILPLCAGGCPQKAAKETTFTICDSIKYNLDTIISNCYQL